VRAAVHDAVRLVQVRTGGPGRDDLLAGELDELQTDVADELSADLGGRSRDHDLGRGALIHAASLPATEPGALAGLSTPDSPPWPASG
jgi:hypothetical protein